MTGQLHDTHQWLSSIWPENYQIQNIKTSIISDVWRLLHLRRPSATYLFFYKQWESEWWGLVLEIKFTGRGGELFLKKNIFFKWHYQNTFFFLFLFLFSFWSWKDFLLFKCFSYQPEKLFIEIEGSPLVLAIQLVPTFLWWRWCCSNDKESRQS